MPETPTVNITQGAKMPLLTSSEVAERLRVNVATVRRYASNGALPAVRLGGAYRFPAARIEQLERGQTSAPRRNPPMPTKSKLKPIDGPACHDDDSETAQLMALAGAFRAGDESTIDTLANRLLLSRPAVRILRTLVQEHDELTKAASGLEKHRAERQAAADELDRLRMVRPMSVEHSE
jgi:excisionase family DNA binding protein